MKGKLKKPIAIAVAAIVLLAADAALTWRLATRSCDAARAAISGVIEAENADPISQFRTRREQVRARLTSQLNDVIHSEESDGEALRQAQRQLLDMLAAQSAEVTLEGVLQSRGFEDALVTVSGSSVNVLLRQQTVTQQESAVILDLVMRETGVTGGNVKIIPIK